MRVIPSQKLIAPPAPGADDGPMTWTAPNVERTEPPEVAGERKALQGWLDYHRATLLFKCQGLTPERLARLAHRVERIEIALLDALNGAL